MAICDETKPYLFVSYSHKNTDTVIAIMDQLRAKGFNVWFDGGIDPGTEWDENIAKHIKASAFFIAFVSKGYVDSKNCKDELNYSRDLDKNQLLVYLEDTEIPDGMAMRMNRIQAIWYNKYDETNIDEFYSKLFNAPGIEKARVHVTADSQLEEEVRSEAYTEPLSTNYNNQSTSKNANVSDGVKKNGANDKYGMIALLLGIFSIATFGAFIFPEIGAIILGLNTRGENGKMSEMGKIGFWCGIISVILVVASVIVYLVSELAM